MSDGLIQWEYLEYTGGNISIDKLNKIGAKGWEYVDSFANLKILLFKRKTLKDNIIDKSKEASRTYITTHIVEIVKNVIELVDANTFENEAMYVKALEQAMYMSIRAFLVNKNVSIEPPSKPCT